MKNRFTLWLLVICSTVTAQSKLTENTLRLDAPANMPTASIDDLAWLTGRWLGEGFGGILEENWNPPIGGAMVATFRSIKEGKPNFYEICLIAPEGNSLVYKVKHFNPDLTGWEEKDDYVTFPLVKLKPNAVYFEGLTMILEGNNCNLFLAMKQKDGSYQEAALTYIRTN